MAQGSKRRKEDLDGLDSALSELTDVCVEPLGDACLRITVTPTSADLWLRRAFEVELGESYGEHPPRVICKTDISTLSNDAAKTDRLGRRITRKGRLKIPLLKCDLAASDDEDEDDGDDDDDDDDDDDCNMGYGWLIDYDLATVLHALRGLFVASATCPYTKQVVDVGSAAAAGRRVSVVAGQAELQGIRPSMEDRIILNTDLLGASGPGAIPAASRGGGKIFTPHLRGPVTLVAVCDGHGGQLAAAFVADHLPGELAACLGKGTAPPRAIWEAVASVDRKLLEHVAKLEEASDHDDDDDDELGAGTTSVFVVLDSLGRLYCGNVGDSRAVLCRDGVAIDLSRDHKAYSPQEMALVVDAGGFIVNRRVMGELAVGRALGDANMKEGRRAVLPAAPEVCACALCADDEFVLLGCDGLFDVMSSQEAVDFVRAGLARGASPEQLCKEIGAHAIEELKSDDNVSVLIAKLDVSGLGAGQALAASQPSSLFGSKPAAMVDPAAAAAPATAAAAAAAADRKAETGSSSSHPGNGGRRVAPVVPSRLETPAAATAATSAPAAARVKPIVPQKMIVSVVDRSVRAAPAPARARKPSAAGSAAGNGASGGRTTSGEVADRWRKKAHRRRSSATRSLSGNSHDNVAKGSSSGGAGSGSSSSDSFVAPAGKEGGTSSFLAQQYLRRAQGGQGREGAETGGPAPLEDSSERTGHARSASAKMGHSSTAAASTAAHLLNDELRLARSASDPVYLLDESGNPIGPYEVQHVVAWFASGQIRPDRLMSVGDQWMAASEGLPLITADSADGTAAFGASPPASRPGSLRVAENGNRGAAPRKGSTADMILRGRAKSRVVSTRQAHRSVDRSSVKGRPPSIGKRPPSISRSAAAAAVAVSSLAAQTLGGASSTGDADAADYSNAHWWYILQEDGNVDGPEDGPAMALKLRSGTLGTEQLVSAGEDWPWVTAASVAKHFEVAAEVTTSELLIPETREPATSDLTVPAHLQQGQPVVGGAQSSAGASAIAAVSTSPILQAAEAPASGPPEQDIVAASVSLAKSSASTALARNICEWIEAVTGLDPGGTDALGLRDGVLLCELLNCYERGIVRRVNRSSMPFKQRGT